MLVSNKREKIKKAKFRASQSKEPCRHYEHKELGYNYGMSNISAGIGRGQLKVLNQRVSEKKFIFDYYKKELGHIKEIEFMPINEWNRPNYWLSCIVLNGKHKPVDVIRRLEKANIESRPLWKPMHLQPFFAEYDYIGGTVSADLFERGLCLPSDTNMTLDDLARVCETIKAIFK